MFSADTLNQARQALIDIGHQRLSLMSQVNEQGRKISDLEREVQRQATACSQAQQALADARREVEALRSQLPDAATQSAYDALVQYLGSASESHPELRIAA